jgi:hypothetical protein
MGIHLVDPTCAGGNLTGKLIVNNILLPLSKTVKIGLVLALAVFDCWFFVENSNLTDRCRQ